MSARLRGMRARVLVLVLVLALALRSADAQANGRFPASNAVVLTADDPDLILARSTFGVLVSRDRGRTWGWVCERAIGFSSSEDPTYVTRGDGSIAAATFMGVRVSSDLGCSWRSSAGVEREVVVDLAAAPRGEVLALASGYDRQDDAGTMLFRTTLFTTSDFGRTFTRLGRPLDPALLAYTIEAAPSDGARVYVSAAGKVGDLNGQGVFFRSNDGGRTLVRADLPLVAGERSAYIAAVDPRRPDRIYVRTAGGPETASRLLVSDDGGKRFRAVFVAKGPLAGFALSPDGGTVFIGGPLDGLLVARASDLTFTKTSSVQVQCLAASADATWVCSNEVSGFFLATTKDGASFDVKLHLQQLAGMLACPADSDVARECAKEWPQLRRNLGIADPAVPPADAPARLRPSATRPPTHQRVIAGIVAALVAVGGVVLWRRRRLSR